MINMSTAVCIKLQTVVWKFSPTINEIGHYSDKIFFNRGNDFVPRNYLKKHLTMAFFRIKPQLVIKNTQIPNF